MKLVITEKKSVAESIAKVVGADSAQTDCFEGNGFIVSWAQGHLYSLLNPDEYDPKLKKWKIDTLPFIPETWKYGRLKNCSQRIDALNKLIRRKDVTEIVNACDAGREGELIFREIYNKSGTDKPMFRLWTSSLENDAIKDGMNSLRSGKEYDNLFSAAETRAKADWIIGMNCSRLYTLQYRKTIPGDSTSAVHVGRVVSPALAMIVQRENEIRNFVSEPFWNIVLTVNGTEFTGERITDKNYAEAVFSEAHQHRFTVTDVETAQKKENPVKLYDLTTLQREANRKFGYSAQQTLDIVQQLYEQKLCTYPRTDSRYLTDDMADAVPQITDISAMIAGVEVPEQINPGIICNTGKVSDHHALIPTKNATIETVEKLDDSSQNIIKLIALCAVKAVSPAFRYTETTVTGTCGYDKYTAKGIKVDDIGWRKYEPKGDKDIPDFRKNVSFPVSDVSMNEGRTTPKKHFTEDTLLAAMETAGAEDMPDDAERKGLGTPATRAETIEKLMKHGLTERKTDKKVTYILPTEAGVRLAEVLDDTLKTPKMTAEWEYGLKDIEHGRKKDLEVLGEIRTYVENLVNETKSRTLSNDETFPVKNSTSEIVCRCPNCGGSIIEKPKLFECTNPECEFKLWKNNWFWTDRDIKITAELLKELCSGETYVKNVLSKDGQKRYSLIVTMKTENNGSKVSFEYRYPNDRK